MIGAATRPLVGRETEQRLIAGLLDRVAEGSGAALFLSGETGIGKTALAHHALGAARERGFLLVEGRARPLDKSLAYAPIIGAFGGFLRRCSERRRDELVAGLSALGRLFQDLGLPVPRPLGDPVLEKTRLFEAVLRLLGRMASQAPVALMLDDLHWSDEASLELLVYLSRELGGLPVLTVVTYRPEELIDPASGFQVLRESLLRVGPGHELALDRLSDEEAEKVLEQFMGEGASPGVLELVARRAQGVPLFIEAFARWLSDTGRLTGSGELRDPGAEEELPPLIEEVVAGRLERLSAAEREVLDLVAVGGEGTKSDLLQEVVGTDPGASLAALGGTGLLTEDAGASAPSYRFHHPLVQEVVYRRIRPPRRRALHMRFAEASQRGGALMRAGAHTLAALPSVPGKWAAAVLEQAGREALERSAEREAARFFEAALSLAEEAQPDLVTQALRGLGEARFRAGQLEAAIRAWRDALERRSGDGDPRLSADLFVRIASAQSELAHYTAADRSIEAGLTALADLPPTEVHLELLWTKEIASARRFDHQRVAEAAGRLQALAGTVATARAAALARTARLFALLNEGRYQEATAELSEMERLVEEAGDPDLLRRLCDARSQLAAVAGDLPALRESVRRTEEVGREIGVPIWYYRLHLYPFVEAFYSGEWGRAWEVIREAEIVAEAGDHPMTSLLPILGALLAVYQGDYEDAERRLETSHSREDLSDRPNTSAFLDIVGALVALEGSDAPRALELVEHYADRFGLASLPPWRFVALAEARVATGRLEQARAAIARLEQLGGKGTYPRAMGARLEGLARFAENRPGDAVDSLLEARRGFERLGMPFEAARATIEVGEVLARMAPERLRSLTEDLKVAHRTAGRLEATIYRERAARLLHAAGSPVPGPEPDDEKLTPRQWEVARLVSEGLSNAQIAERLFISVRTVTSHLDHIYTRLGMNSRAALAAYVIELRYRNT